MHISTECSDWFERIGEGCYFYSQTLLITEWEDAKTFCEQINGHLAIINDEQENRALVEHILFDTACKKILLGVNLTISYLGSDLYLPEGLRVHLKRIHVVVTCSFGFVSRWIPVGPRTVSPQDLVQKDFFLAVLIMLTITLSGVIHILIEILCRITYSGIVSKQCATFIQILPFIISVEADVLFIGAYKNERDSFEWLDGTLVEDG